MADGSDWPRISIVTPSYNQGQFLEETIRSVLLQGYRNLEYIIIDGGSSDDSVAIVRKYERWLTYWVSEPDQGQAHAINKGLEHASGQIFNWINSDDLLLPGALFRIATGLDNGDAIAGGVVNSGDAGERLVLSANLSYRNLLLWSRDCTYQQPGTWLRLSQLKRLPPLSEHLHYCFDYELMLRYLQSFPHIAYTAAPLARFRLHPTSKTVSHGRGFDVEMRRIWRELSRTAPDGRTRAVCAALAHARRGQQAWYRYLERIHGSSAPRTRRVGSVILHAVESPRFRLSRLTLGAIRRIAAS